MKLKEIIQFVFCYISLIKSVNTPKKLQENVLWHFLVTGGVQKNISKVYQDWSTRRDLNMTSQKMAVVARGVRIIYSHLLNSAISYQFVLSRKRSIVFCSIGSVEEHTKSLPKLVRQKGAKYCAKKHGRRCMAGKNSRILLT